MTRRDLEQLLACESFKPQIFSNYIKILSEINEVGQDCMGVIDTLFQAGETIPAWADLALRRQTKKDGADVASDNANIDWNKVVVMDPPSLVMVEVAAPTTTAEEAHEDSPVAFNQGSFEEATSSKFIVETGVDFPSGNNFKVEGQSSQPHYGSTTSDQVAVPTYSHKTGESGDMDILVQDEPETAIERADSFIE